MHQPKPEQPPTLHRSTIARALLLLAALACLGLGIVGVFVPGMPTTVFILMAAWFAARGSPRLLAWIERHRVFGAMVRDWRANRTVSRRAKWSATLTMLLSAVLLFALPVKLWIALLSTAIMTTVGTWLWFRPEPKRSGPPQG